MRKSVLLIALPLFIVGCAKRPDAIVPVDIPMAAYGNESCKGLAREMIAEQNKLAALSKAQNNAANGDAFGVFLIGVPMSSTFGGDKEGELAVSKGKIVALENAMKAKNCN